VIRGIPWPMPIATPELTTVRQLGERACVIDLGADFTAARAADDLAAGAAGGGAREFVFDLTHVRRYEAEALFDLAALCRRLVSYGCEVLVAAHDPGVTLELRRLAHGDGWTISPTLSAALTGLLSRPV
jgi:anti-anti-sigma regulatory factor